MAISPDRVLKNLIDFHFENETIGVIKSTRHKVYIKKVDSDSTKISKLIQEYNQQVKCFHIFLQTAVGFFHSKKSTVYYLITPYHKNGTLRHFINFSPYFSTSNNLSLSMVCDIASGMKYLHKVDILHQNLDPDHILINDTNHPVLIGFGVPSNNSNDNYQIYSAPEILRNEEYTKKSDVYSFGLIVNEIYSQNKPFSGISIEDMIQLKNNGNFEIHASMPDFLQNIVRRCINPNPEMRPTFKDIILELKNSEHVIQDLTIASYLDKIKYLSKQIRTFSIPKQILKPIRKNIRFNDVIENPINFNELERIFPQDCNQKVIIITILGDDEVSKMSFVGTLTGNAAYMPYVSQLSFHAGVLVDGPYSKQQLTTNVFDQSFKEQFDILNISNDTLIFFVIPQADIANIFHITHCMSKITEIFCAVSFACFTIMNPNVSPTRLVRKLRNMNLLAKNKITHSFVLVKNFEHFDSFDDVDINTFLNLDNSLENLFKQMVIDSNESELNNHLNVLPIGNYEKNHKSYVFSVWYSFLVLLSKVKEDDLISVNKISNALKVTTHSLFGENQKKLNDYEDKNKIKNLFPMMNDLYNALGKCILCTDYAQYHINRILHVKDNNMYNLALLLAKNIPKETFSKKQLREVEQIIVYYSDILLPLLLNNFNIPINHIRQYSNIVKRDLNTYLKVNNIEWLKHVNFEKNRIFFDDMYDLDPISLKIEEIDQHLKYPALEITGAILFATLNGLFNNFQSSTFPFIWNYQMTTKFLGINYNIIEGKPIGSYKEQLIVFIEQNSNNDSTRIFRALTGFDVDYKKYQKISIIFYNVPVSALMDRFKKNRANGHVSKLIDPPVKKVDIMYIKGYNQKIIRNFCKKQIRKPILVSSMLQGQKINLYPGPQYEFNMFVISCDSFDYEIPNRKNYVLNMTRAKQIVLDYNEHMKNMNFLPVLSKDYNFPYAGPACNELIKYGCRFIMKDESFYKDQ